MGDLKAFFETFGKVAESDVLLDSTGCSKRCGYVKMEDPSVTELILDKPEIEMSGTTIAVMPYEDRENIAKQRSCNGWDGQRHTALKSVAEAVFHAKPKAANSDGQYQAVWGTPKSASTGPYSGGGYAVA